jgi:hypothetical protein
LVGRHAKRNHRKVRVVGGLQIMKKGNVGAFEAHFKAVKEGSA